MRRLAGFSCGLPQGGWRDTLLQGVSVVPLQLSSCCIRECGELSGLASNWGTITIHVTKKTKPERLRSGRYERQRQGRRSRRSHRKRHEQPPTRQCAVDIKTRRLPREFGHYSSTVLLVCSRPRVAALLTASRSRDEHRVRVEAGTTNFEFALVVGQDKRSALQAAAQRMDGSSIVSRHEGRASCAGGRVFIWHRCTRLHIRTFWLVQA